MKRDFGFVQRLIRGYTFYSPLQKGKFRLSELALRLSKQLEGEIVVKTSDNRDFLIDTSNSSYRFVYFLGEYEGAISKLLGQIIKPGDICLDIGANIGWYTTLFQKLVGPSGEVHAFEPVPSIFEHLHRNVKLNEPPQNVRLNNFALGDVEKDVDLHIFSDLPSGHASISTFDKTNFEIHPSRMKTLDSYLSANSIEDVALVKMDIEGAELMMLKGASKLFEQKRLPVFEIEMALDTTRGFDYLPNDLIEYIDKKAEYNFFAIDERYSNLKQINGFAPTDKGANVLCLPHDFDKKPLLKWFK